MQSEENPRPRRLYRKSVIFLCMLYVVSAPLLLQRIGNQEKPKYIPRVTVDSNAGIDNRYFNNKKQIASLGIEKSQLFKFIKN
jgi:hypothetical protein